MKSIFTKTLIAAAVASIGSAQAANVYSVDSGTATGIQQVISSEGLALAKTIVVGNTAGMSTSELQVAIDPEIITYEDSDLLEFTFGGAEIDTSATTLSSVRVTDGSTAVASGFGFITKDGKTVGVRLDVTSATAINTAAAATNGRIYLTNVTLKNVDSAISVAYQGSRNSNAFDQASSTEVAQVASSFTVTAPGTGTSLDATIDVENSRKSFVTGVEDTDEFYNDGGDAGSKTTDTYKLTAKATSNLLPVTISKAVHTLVPGSGGNLDFLKNSAGTALDSSKVAGSAGTVDSAPTAALTTDGNLTVQYDGAIADATGIQHIIALTVNQSAELIPQTFTGSSKITYTYGTATPVTFDVDSYTVGTWGLSGATQLVEFMPFGSGITQFFYVANSSSVAGDIEVSAIDQSGTVYKGGTLGVSAAANSVTNVGAEVISKLTAAGANTSSGRLAITLVINAPKADIEVTAGYNARGNRVLVD